MCKTHNSSLILVIADVCVSLLRHLMEDIVEFQTLIVGIKRKCSVLDPLICSIWIHKCFFIATWLIVNLSDFFRCLPILPSVSGWCRLPSSCRCQPMRMCCQQEQTELSPRMRIMTLCQAILAVKAKNTDFFRSWKQLKEIYCQREWRNIFKDMYICVK